MNILYLINYKTMSKKKIATSALTALLKFSKNPELMKNLIDICSDDAILSLVSVCANLIHNKRFGDKIPPLKLRKLKNKMKPHSADWIKITKNKTNLKKKRDFLSKQIGNGVLGQIANIISPLLSILPLFI